MAEGGAGDTADAGGASHSRETGLDGGLGELVVSGGGSYAVASDALFADAHSLELVQSEMGRAVDALQRIDRGVGEKLLRGADAPLSALDAERELDRSQQLVAAAGDRAAAIALVLRASAEGYGLADAGAQRMAQSLAASLGYSVGLLLPLFAAVMAPALPAALAGLLVASLLVPGGPAAVPGGIAAWLAENNRLLTNPLTVALVRAGVMSVDDVVGGALGVPPAVVRALGDEGAQMVGLGTSAALIALLGPRAGLFTETAVTARRAVQRDLAAPPGGLAERIDRIPQRVRDEKGEPAGQHIRIERYTAPGEPDRFEVYITGTADFSPRAGTEPFDLTSDIGTMADLPAGAVRAVQQAMQQEGITAETPVQFTGYSQGGLIAASLAASGDYNTQGVLAVGSPTAHVEVGADFPVIAIEHTDDIVPAMGGMRTGNDAVLVEREAFAGRDTPAGVAVPSHDRGEYRDTAELADRARSPRLVAARESLEGFTDGTTPVSSTTYVAERAP